MTKNGSDLMLLMRNVSKTYKNGVNALYNINLTIDVGW